jgi:pyroglutamyl-peptidase
MRTILVTGFGPFPGAPFNPTATLAARLSRIRRPNLRVVSHIFPTEYAAVDRDLPNLIERHRPDALLMFGLHGRTRTLRIETRARNAIGHHRDAGGRYIKMRTIVAGAPHAMMSEPATRLLRAARRTGVPAVLSRDAGSYLCNYLCWRATERIGKNLRFTAFIHVPPVTRKDLPPGTSLLRNATLQRAAGAMLAELARCLGSAGIRA